MTATAVPPPAVLGDPLSGTAAAMASALGWLDVLVGDPAQTLGPADDVLAGWLRCEDVVATVDDPDGVLARWRRRLTTAQGAVRGLPHSEVPAQVPAMLQLLWLLDVPAYAAGLAFGLHRRLPDVRPQSLAFRLHPDEWFPEAVALRSPRFACLPDDPAADSPHAHVVPDERALAELVRTRVVAHAAAVLTRWSPGPKLGSRQRWGAVTDALDTALQVSGKARGDAELGRADAELVLGGAGRSCGQAPFTSGTTQHPIEDDRGRTYWGRTRTSCCYFYAYPGAQACFGCPRTTDDERRARVSSWERLPG